MTTSQILSKDIGDKEYMMLVWINYELSNFSILRFININMFVKGNNKRMYM